MNAANNLNARRDTARIEALQEAARPSPATSTATHKRRRKDRQAERVEQRRVIAIERAIERLVVEIGGSRRAGNQQDAVGAEQLAHCNERERANIATAAAALPSRFSCSRLLTTYRRHRMRSRANKRKQTAKRTKSSFERKKAGISSIVCASSDVAV